MTCHSLGVFYRHDALNILLSNANIQLNPKRTLFFTTYCIHKSSNDNERPSLWRRKFQYKGFDATAIPISYDMKVSKIPTPINGLQSGTNEDRPDFINFYNANLHP